ncbi:MAG TPA: hypothetical protein VKZ85_02245 [Woeseiaceae bacterium]|nr:hypothetical protein [Woeseiaceae bacterium]
MNGTSISCAGRWLALSAALLLAGQPAALAGQGAGKRITGVWTAHVNITNCLPGNVPGPVVFASFEAMNLFAADGSFLDANSLDPALASPHLGYWRHIRGNQYEFAQKFYMFDAGGNATGWRIVRHEVLLHKNGMSFTSGGYAETFDMDGELVATGCSTSSAVRFD